MLYKYYTSWIVLLSAFMFATTSENTYAGAEQVSLIPASILSLIIKIKYSTLFLFFVDGIFNFFKKDRFAPLQFRFFVLYLILFVDSLLMGDRLRYAVLLSMFIFIPFELRLLIIKKGIRNVLRLFFFVVCLLSLFGLFCSMRAGLTLRYTGWVSNPNMYILINTFFIAIVFANILFRTLKSLYLYPVLFFLLYSQLAAGSRNGLFALLILSASFMFILRVKKIYYLFLFLFSSAIYVVFSLYGPEASHRIFEIKEALGDTGRETLWQSLWPFIQSKWWFGWGTLGKDLIGYSGNSHNSYVTFLIFFGVPGGILMGLGFVLSALSSLISTRDKFPFLIFSAYIISFILNMFGEDMFMGLGSPFVLQLILAIGFADAWRYDMTMGWENYRPVR